MRLPVLVFSAALAAPLFAQETKPSGIELRLLAFQPGMASEEVFAHNPAAGSETPAVQTPLKTYLNHEFSRVMPAGGKMVFTTGAENESLSRDESLLAEVTLPAGVRSAILLFLPEKAGLKFRYRVLVIDDSKRAFPPGSFRVSNLSPQPVRIVLEDENYEFKPGQTELIKDPPVRAGNQSGMKAFSFQNNSWQRIGSGIWPHPGGNRVVQVLFLNPASGQIQLRAFDDVPPREPAP